MVIIIFTVNVAGVAAADESYYKMKKGDTKDHPLSHWFLKFSEADELFKLTATRHKVYAAYFTFHYIGLLA